MSKLTTRLKRFISLIPESLNDSEKEFTSGSINTAIVLLSIPMILEMLMEALFAIVDVYFVSSISTNAIATVGLTESVLTIIYSAAVGLSMATTAIVARRVGEKNHKKAANAGFQSVLLASIIGLALGIVGFIFSEEVLQLMGGKPDLIKEGVGFTKIMFAGNLSIFLLFLNNAIFRGAGDASIAMRALIISNGLNFFLDPLFIFGLGPIPAMGIEGAAIATTLGRSIGVAYQFYHLLNKRGVIRIGWENVVVRMKTIIELIQISAGGMGQFLIESASWIFLVRVISHFGSDALAGYTLAMRVIVFTILPAWGLSNAAATLVGQNLGAEKPDRAEKSVWKVAWYNTAYLGLVSVIFIVASGLIIGLFDQPEAVTAIGTSGLTIVSFGYLFFAFGMVISQAFNGAGDTRTPLIVNLVVFWVIQIPLAYTLAITLGMKETGVFASIAFCHSLQAVISILIFRKGKWKLMKV